jgi:phospholipid/cholesterol/gamma-HCH transport system permease protein
VATGAGDAGLGIGKPAAAPKAPAPAPPRVRVATTRILERPRNGVSEVGAMVLLLRETLIKIFRPPYNWGPEFASQFVFGMRVAWFPMIIASLAFTYGPAGIQAAGFLKLVGALDRLGGIFALVVIREFAPLVCAIVMAGVVGTAICADLGARRIREELDALMVLGIDPIRSLVVPRFVALIALTSLFDVYALLFGTFGGMLVTISNGEPVGPFFNSYFTNATTVEFGASLIKTGLYGGMIALVCCYKGLTAKGGSEGVGRAVNQAIVIAFLGIGAIDYVFTQAVLATNPDLTTVR